MKIQDILFNFLIYIFIITLPILPEDLKYKGIPINGTGVLLFIIMIYIFKVILFRDSKRRLFQGLRESFHDYLSIFMFLLFIVMCISTFYSRNINIAINESLRFLTYIMLFFIIKYEIISEKAKENMIKCYISICAILSIMGIVQYFTRIGLDKQFITGYKSGAKVRITTTLSNPNNYGAFLIIALFPLIMLAMYEKKLIKKVIYGIIAIMVFTNIIFTSSRNALLGILVGCLILLIMYTWKLIFVFGFIATGTLMVPQVLNRVKEIMDPAQNESRIKIWKTALYMIKDHPIRGVGNGNFTSYYEEYVTKYPKLSYYGIKNFPSHNSYLKIQSELGVLGSISFIGILIIAFIKIKNFVNTARSKFLKSFYLGFLASTGAFYFINLIDNLFFVPKTTTYFWILLAISQSFSYSNKE